MGGECAIHRHLSKSEVSPLVPCRPYCHNASYEVKVAPSRCETKHIYFVTGFNADLRLDVPSVREQGVSAAQLRNKCRGVTARTRGHMSNSIHYRGGNLFCGFSILLNKSKNWLCLSRLSRSPTTEDTGIGGGFCIVIKKTTVFFNP